MDLARTRAKNSILRPSMHGPVDREAAEGVKGMYKKETLLEMTMREAAEVKAEEDSNKPENQPTKADLIMKQLEELQQRGTFGLNQDRELEGIIMSISTCMPGDRLFRPCQTILTKLDLSGRSLGNDFAMLLATYLEMKVCTLIELKLCNCKINTEGVDALGEALKNNCVMQYVTLVETKLPIQVLRGAIDHHTMAGVSMQKIDLSYQNVESLDMALIGRLLLVNVYYRSLDLAHNTIIWANSLWGHQEGRYHGFLELIHSVLHVDSTTSLDLQHNHLMNEGLDSLSQLVEQSRALQVLTISGNEMGLNNVGKKVHCFGTSSLAEALQNSQNLTILDISNNELDGQDAEQIANALRSQDVLAELDFSLNLIGPFGAMAFAKMLIDNR